MQKIAFWVVALACWMQPAAASQLSFDIVARIDSAGLISPSETAKLPVDGTLYGRMTYSDTPSRRIGNTHYFGAGAETLRFWTDEGYERAFGNALVDYGSLPDRDFFYAASFVSEDPNGWNLFIDVLATDWLLGRDTLPIAFPDSFETAYISAYKTDEGDQIETFEATILSITPTVTTVPAPPAGMLLLTAFGTVFLGRRYRRRTGCRPLNT
ncbi:MAG: hypothetical protein AB8B58_05070 [Roseobacter sp.]